MFLHLNNPRVSPSLTLNSSRGDRQTVCWDWVWDDCRRLLTHWLDLMLQFKGRDLLLEDGDIGGTLDELLMAWKNEDLLVGDLRAKLMISQSFFIKVLVELCLTSFIGIGTDFSSWLLELVDCITKSGWLVVVTDTLQPSSLWLLPSISWMLLWEADCLVSLRSDLVKTLNLLVSDLLLPVLLVGVWCSSDFMGTNWMKRQCFNTGIGVDMLATCGDRDTLRKKLGQFDSLDWALVPKNTHIEESNWPTFGLVSRCRAWI